MTPNNDTLKMLLLLLVIAGLAMLPAIINPPTRVNPVIKIYTDDLIERLPHEPRPPVILKTSFRGRGLGSKDIVGRRRQDEEAQKYEAVVEPQKTIPEEATQKGKNRWHHRGTTHNEDFLINVVDNHLHKGEPRWFERSISDLAEEILMKITIY